MLHSYSVKNSLSFKENAEVSFRLTQKASSRGWDEESITGHRLATAMAIVGPNAAGKTSLIKPLAFLSSVHHPLVPAKPAHRTDSDQAALLDPARAGRI